MNGYIVTSVVTGAAGMAIFTWVLGLWPNWAYPKMSDTACLATILAGIVMSITLFMTSAVAGDRAERTPEPVDRTIPTCTGAATERPGHVVTIDTVEVSHG